MWLTTNVSFSPDVEWSVCIRSGKVKNWETGGLILYRGKHEVSDCTAKFRKGLVIIGGTYRSPSCHTGNVFLSNIHTRSKDDHCHIGEKFNRTHQVIRAHNLRWML